MLALCGLEEGHSLTGAPKAGSYPELQPTSQRRANSINNDRNSKQLYEDSRIWRKDLDLVTQ